MSLTLVVYLSDSAEYDTFEKDVIVVCYVTILLCLAGEFLLQRFLSVFFVVMLHMVSTLLLLNTLRSSFGHIDLLIMVVLAVNIGLRLQIGLVVVFYAAVLLFGWLIDLQKGCSTVHLLTDLSVLCLVMFLIESRVLLREKLVATVNLIESQNQSIRNLTDANQSFVEYIEDAREDSAETERMRITRELHDVIGYSMTNIVAMMNASKYLVKDNPAKLEDYCEKTRAMAASTLDEARAILYELRSVKRMGRMEPPHFFAKLCKDFSDAIGVQVDCHTGNLPRSINDVAFHVLFRILQVGLINAVRHGSTAHIKVLFWMSDDQLTMTVWNNLASDAASNGQFVEGIGLKGISERLAGLEGRLRYGPVIDGFKLVASIPRANVYREQRSKPK